MYDHKIWWKNSIINILSKNKTYFSIFQVTCQSLSMYNRLGSSMENTHVL